MTFHNHPPGCCSVRSTLRCEHQVEIEVWPANGEVYFADERYADPATAQLRFDAVVYNAQTSRVLWEVRDANGNPGNGTIDHTGLYRAPEKGSLANGTTDIVCATAADDPLRKAFAFVTIVGRGSAPQPVPTLILVPKVSVIYYPPNTTSGKHNDYMNPVNSMQVFQAVIGRTEDREVIWTVGGAVQAGVTLPWYKYQAQGSGSPTEITLRAKLKNHPSVSDEARVKIINYDWPGIVP